MQGLDLRDGVDGLTVLAASNLAALWQQVSDAVQAREALNDVLPGLIDTYGLAAAALAADWYDELRAKTGIGGSFTAIPADIKDSGVFALIGWAEKETEQTQDFAAFRTLIEGGMQRRIANFSRLTVTESTVADPKAVGWQRVGTGECPFCRLLIGRGAVYSRATADFSAHDHCRCSAVPAWGGLPRPVKPYTPSLRGTSKADQDRAKKWIAEHL